MRILLTNDDGIYAPGIAALKRHSSALGEVTVVAPDSERSAAGHSITLDRPLRVREVYVGDSLLVYSVDGSPADCVTMRVRRVLRQLPDPVLAGRRPGAAYMVASISSIRRRTSAATRPTGAERSLSRRSGAMMTGSRAMARNLSPRVSPGN